MWISLSSSFMIIDGCVIVTVIQFKWTFCKYFFFGGKFFYSFLIENIIINLAKERKKMDNNSSEKNDQVELFRISLSKFKDLEWIDVPYWLVFSNIVLSGCFVLRYYVDNRLFLCVWMQKEIKSHLFVYGKSFQTGRDFTQIIKNDFFLGEIPKKKL